MNLLVANWKDILLKAWSIRLISLAILVQAMEEILPSLEVVLSPDLYQWATMGFLTMAAIVRLMPQANLSD